MDVLDLRRSALGKRLSDARKGAGYTQAEAARALGLSRQALSKWESGESVPSALQVADAAILYGISLDDLILGVQTAAAWERIKAAAKP